ncbi:hypothetical protein Rfer_4370 (plasmid) [Rhodoferax ferrireducens T118]|uniref:Uncharacterized protein n=1 Tax=Albidiferax ferrireducens (strain ATCC BAA-621 / DSM 15236 / T118) TaxID=338969 RepID=Q21Q89_ALBFT|nr:DUF4222 domain-containing protein [Rhodoferax ferrireducens]ABD72056.1 hypothetical protein Rfer_4370 [Rhodoferax ferrireducens T118]
MSSKNIGRDADTDRTHLLQDWTVRYGTDALIFNCQAENIGHAISQCANAYPGDTIVSAFLDALTGTNSVIVALPAAFQLMVDGSPRSGPWFVIVDKTTGDLAPDLVIGDVACYQSYDEARQALDFNLTEYAKESARTAQPSQDSPRQSDDDAKRARISAAGYTIQSQGIGTAMEGWWALLPGETEFHAAEEGENQNYLGFFSNEQDLLDELDDSLTDNALSSSKLYTDETGYTVEISAMDMENVAFARQGGGLLVTMPRKEFEAKFKPTTVPEFSLIGVKAEWLPDDLKVYAYSQGLRWNGWAMPRFELSAALKLLEYIPELRWNSARDEFRLQPGEPEDVWTGEDVQVGNRTLHLYPIGAGSWCWDQERAIPTLDETIALMKKEILLDVRGRRVPMDVKTFSDLHAYVDANEYGEFCVDSVADAMIAYFGGRDEHEGMPDRMLEYINAAQNAINEWLAAGGLLTEIGQLADVERAKLETDGALLRERKAPHPLVGQSFTGEGTPSAIDSSNSKTAIDIVLAVCNDFDGNGIYSVGTSAALRAMAVHWQHHIAQGDNPKVISDDLDEMRNQLEVMRAEIMRRIA